MFRTGELHNREIKRIAVVGLGYIGLPTAAMFASCKVEVIGIDIDPRTVETINRGQIHIVEPDLDMVVKEAVLGGYLRATTIPEKADAFLIAVPTPLKSPDHNPDLAYVEAASKAIAPVLEPGNLIILESTSPVGATESMASWLAECRPDLTFPQNHGEMSDIRVAYCPERVLPGKVMQELITNDRVIGGLTPKCSEIAASLYRKFVTGECITASGPRAAEMSKLTENAFRDINIAFANELSLICDKLGIDVWELIQLANRHPRVSILQPGPGVGGHCIAVDPWFIVASAPQDARIIQTARAVNDSKPGWVIEQVHNAVALHLVENPDKSPEEVVVACYGLAFKPDIDDLRESPALEIVFKLGQQLRARLLTVDPFVENLPQNLEGIASLELFEKAYQEADIHVMLVDHSKFKDSNAPSGGIVDTRGVWR